MAATDPLEPLRRRYLLDFLRDSPGMSSNLEIASMALNARHLASTEAQTEASLRWLSEIGALRLTSGALPLAAGSRLLAELSRHGADLAAGRAVHSGLSPWRPGV